MLENMHIWTEFLVSLFFQKNIVGPCSKLCCCLFSRHNATAVSLHNIKFKHHKCGYCEHFEVPAFRMAKQIRKPALEKTMTSFQSICQTSCQQKHKVGGLKVTYMQGMHDWACTQTYDVETAGIPHLLGDCQHSALLFSKPVPILSVSHSA